MASIRIHQDQENRIEMRQKQNVMAAVKKRPILGSIDANKIEDRQVKGKKPLGPSLKQDLKQVEQFQNRENLRKFVNPIVPVAQFEAFKVYEDKQNEILDAPKVKHESELPKDGLFEIPEDVIEASPQDMSIQSISSPMNTDNTLDESTILAEHKIIEQQANSVELGDVEEYRPEIFTYLREHELSHRPKPLYMRKQLDINHNMRTILVDWLVEVAEEYKLHSETLYLAVNFIDRFLSYMSVVRAKLQLVGTAAMFIAAKYEEIYPPDVSEFVYITDDTYTKRQVIRMEHLILKVLGFDLSIPTPLTFITAISTSNKLTAKITNLALYLSELSLLEADPFLEFLPSVIASSAIALAQHTLSEEVWSKELAESTGHQLMQLKTCVEALNGLFSTASTISHHAIQDKYKTMKYLHVSQISPNKQLIKFE